MNILETCGDWIENKQLIRRIAFFWMICITTYSLIESWHYAWNSARPGMEIAAILAAIWTPLSALQGWALSMYNAGRNQ